MTTTSTAPQLTHQIQDRLERMQALELEQISLTQTIETHRRGNREIECSYILNGIEGSTETVRKAGLDSLIRTDVAHRTNLDVIDKANRQLATIGAALADHKRQLALEMELLRHMRPTE